MWFSVIDIKDAFWTCPLDSRDRHIFAFTWGDPDTGRKQQLCWTRLLQGYTELPTLFGQALEELLQFFSLPSGLQVTQYGDDLLLSREQESTMGTGTIELLSFLGKNGLRVSKTKLQFVMPEVKYLGHIIGQGTRKLSPERIEGILNLPSPGTKHEIRRLLGLVGYCRLWIDQYTQSVKFLYEKLTEQELLTWMTHDDFEFKELKSKLTKAPVLSLPSLEKLFDLYVNVEKGICYEVLTQE